MKNSRLESLDSMTKEELLAVAEECGAEKGRNHCWRCEAWARYVDWDKDHREPVVIDPTPAPFDPAEAWKVIHETMLDHGYLMPTNRVPGTAEHVSVAIWDALQPIIDKIVHNSAPVG